MIGWVNTAFTKLWAWYSGLVGYFKFGEVTAETDDLEAAHGGVHQEGTHTFGEYSLACRTIYPNPICCLQIRASNTSTFLGMYDGNGVSNEAAKFLGRNLHLKITDRVRLGVASGVESTVDLESITLSMNEIEADYKAYVKAEGTAMKNMYASSGCSCLLIVILGDKILIANVGDGKAFSVKEYGMFNMRVASKSEVLNGEKNVNSKSVRDDLVKRLGSSHNLVLRDGTWRVNDEIEVCESLGNLNLKCQEFAGENIGNAEVAQGPVISFEVHTKSVNRDGNIRYLVLANHEFWRFLSEKQVMRAVKSHGRRGIAQHLKEAAVRESKRVKKEIAGDIVIAVVFLDRLEPQNTFRPVTAGNSHLMGGVPPQGYNDSF